MKLQSPSEHPHGLEEDEFDALFTKDKPVIFAYHGYPMLIHRLTYRRTNHKNLHVHGFKEEGTTTTPFDMAVINGLDRFHLLENAVKHLTVLPSEKVSEIELFIQQKLAEHDEYIREHGQDLPEIRDWQWNG